MQAFADLSFTDEILLKLGALNARFYSISYNTISPHYISRVHFFECVHGDGTAREVAFFSPAMQSPLQGDLSGLNESAKIVKIPNKIEEFDFPSFCEDIYRNARVAC